MANGAAQDRYDLLRMGRQPFLDRGRDCAKLTIPTLLPPDGHTGYTKLPTPWQATGARGVNTLAAKLLLSLFPPSAVFFKYEVDDFVLESFGKSRGEVEKALNKVERAVCSEIETSGMRPQLFEALKHLVAVGNVLIYVPDEGSLRLYRLDSYVVKRDPSGNLLEIITHEKISPLELSEDARKLIDKEAPSGRQSTDDYLDLYTRVQRTLTGWKVHQELCGKVVPNSRGTYAKDKNPWHALRLTALDNEDYGRGHCEEYLGDLKSLEALSKAIVQGAAAAAKVIFLVKATGSTKPRTIAKAESGDVKEGNGEDVTVLQLNKYADFKVALELRNSLKEDLAYAFLFNSAIQRNGERVTAEEIRFMAQELETGLGGIYSTLSQDLQLVLVALLMNRMEKAGRLPRLPRKLVKPKIVTGLDAIGRGNDRTRLAAFLQDLGSVDKTGGLITRNVNEPELVKRLGVGGGIDMEGLIKTDQQIALEEQNAQLRAMIDKLGPNAITQLGGLAKQQAGGGTAQ